MNLQPRHPFYDHQNEALAFAAPKDEHALLMEQGTGKTPVAIFDDARRWAEREIDAVFVAAPNGVHSNWVLRELPKHMPEDIDWIATDYTSSPLKRDRERMEKFRAQQGKRTLRFLTMNYEALGTDNGWELALKYCKTFSGRLAIHQDESHRTKNPNSVAARQLRKLRSFARVATLMTGSPILNKPWDAYSQFHWLNPDILKTTSFVAFKSEYSELESPLAQHGMMRHIAMRVFPGKTHEEIQKLIARTPALANKLPTIVKRDPVTGLPMWRNLDRLAALIAPHSFRVLKKDCLDLPEKVYTRSFFKMTARQREAYDRCRDEYRLQLSTGDMTSVTRLASMMKLSQIVSGYFIEPETGAVQWLLPFDKNPKFQLLEAEIEDCVDCGEQFIIWARFHVELEAIAALLKRMKVTFAEYHGEIGSKTLRQEAIDDFEEARVQGFLSQQAAGGTGLTLIAARSSAKRMRIYYFSNTFALGDRIQSEDRSHRIGQEKSTLYDDLVAEDSVDLEIADLLEQKIDVAAIITGDARHVERLLG